MKNKILLIFMLLIGFFSNAQTPSVELKAGSKSSIGGHKGWWEPDSGLIAPNYNAKKSAAGIQFNKPGRFWYDKLGDSSFHYWDGVHEIKLYSVKDSDEIQLIAGAGATGPQGPPGDDGADGTNGIDGKTWYSGSGVPSGGTGVDGDFYFRTSNGDVYKKTSGTWGIIANITGPTGATGPAGADGSGHFFADSILRAYDSLAAHNTRLKNIEQAGYITGAIAASTYVPYTGATGTLAMGGQWITMTGSSQLQIHSSQNYPFSVGTQFHVNDVGSVGTGTISIADGEDITTGTTIGTKIARSTSQKIGFWNTTPVTQRSGNILQALQDVGLVTSPSLSSSNITTALGFTPPPNTRTLTINGTAQDLSSDRTWTIPVPFYADSILLAFDSIAAHNARLLVIEHSGYLTAESDPVALAKTVTIENGYGITGGGAAQAISANPSRTLAIDTTTIYPALFTTFGVGYAIIKNGRTFIFDSATAFVDFLSTIGTGYGITKTGRTFKVDTGTIFSYFMGTMAAGTGMSISGRTFINTAPDQTVTLTGGYGVNTSGTYPNFTIVEDTATTFFKVLSTLAVGYGLNYTGRTFKLDTATAFPALTATLGNGYGILYTGRTFKLDTATIYPGLFGTFGAGTGISLSGRTISISTGYTGQTSITTLGTIATGVWNGTRLTSSYIPTDVAYYDVVQSWTKGQAGTISTLTDASTIAVDLSLGNNLGNVVMAGNRTLGVPTNIVAGQSGTMTFYQDVTGTRTLTPAWIYGGSGGTAITLSTGKLAHDIVSYYVDYYLSSTATMTIASPCVVTQTGHGMPVGGCVKVQFTTTGALPTGVSASTTYYATIVDANTYKLSTTFANAQAATFINTSGSQSGTHTGVIGNITLAILTDSR